MCSDLKIWSSSVVVIIVILLAKVVIALRLLCGFNQLFLFQSFLLFLFLFLLLSERIVTLDNSQSKIEEEKGANEYHGYKEEEGPHCESSLVHDHDLTPTLQSNALEDV